VFVDIPNIEFHWLAFLGGTGSLLVRLKGMEAGYRDFAWSSLTPAYGVQHSEMGRSCITVVHSYVPQLFFSLKASKLTVKDRLDVIRFCCGACAGSGLVGYSNASPHLLLREQPYCKTVSSSVYNFLDVLNLL